MLKTYLTSFRLTILLSILLLALWLRLVNLNQSLWLDEAAQAMASARTLGEQHLLQSDFHPPLYYYLLHFWMILGHSEWVMRLSAVLPGVATVSLVYLIARERDKNSSFPQQHTSSSTNLRVSSLEEKSSPSSYEEGARGSLIGTLAALFFAIAPYHIYYSQELRMYSLATFWAALLIYALLTRKWWLHTLAAIAGIYTLYLFPLMFVAEGLFITLHERKLFKSWLISIVLTFITFLIWVPSLSQQLQQGFQLPTIWPEWRHLSSPGFLKTIPLTFAKFALGRITFDNKILYGGLVSITGLSFTLPLVLSFPRRRAIALSNLREPMVGTSSQVWLLWYWLLVPLALAWLISIWIPLNGPWRLLFTSPALYLLLAIGLYNIPTLFLRKVIIVGIVCISLLGVFLYHLNPRYQREDWKTAVRTIHKLSLQNQAVVTFAFPEPFASYKWYAPNLDNASALTKGLRTNSSADLQTEKLTGQPTIYYFEYLSGLSDPQKLIPQWFITNGYAIKQTYDFRGVGFVHEYRLNVIASN